ncbi:MAG TPA: phosphoribosylamine--glycine ligase [Candidatus Acidoferrum sp.]|nr:phosphoribosylamine--glycine ligase [Candidatus Acidoferrum sp.]
MKILVIGGGGREHAIVWKLKQSRGVERIWCAPGNGGIASDAECLPLNVGDVKAAADLAQRLGADLTVVGPELPLVRGIADEFEKRRLRILGPLQKATQLEGSKVFSKGFLERHGIPTARSLGVFDSTVAARQALRSVSWPVVIKADGLCAGKGVLVAQTIAEAEDFLERALDKREFGEAGRRVLIEEGLAGEELSYIVLTDGESWLAMAPARDHKRAYDGDKGPNTGGMGAYSIDDILPRELEKAIIAAILQPTLEGLKKEGIAYRGFLYIGLMVTREGPKVLEFNCRLGDPETQAILLRADFDFAIACREAADSRLGSVHPQWFPAASAAIVVASEGYPDDPLVGREISGLQEAASVQRSVVFHAGTKLEHGKYYTSGGRVLTAAASGQNLEEACELAYSAAEKIHFEGGYYRRDIGARVAAKSAAGERRNG